IISSPWTPLSQEAAAFRTVLAVAAPPMRSPSSAHGPSAATEPKASVQSAAGDSAAGVRYGPACAWSDLHYRICNENAAATLELSSGVRWICLIITTR